jgi:ABC-type multidrug transport system permease subunit
MNKQALGKCLIIFAAFVSFLFSVGLWFSGQREEGIFVGIWVPSILSFGTLLASGRGGVA